MAIDATSLPASGSLRSELEAAGILLSPGVRHGLVKQALELVAEEFEVTVGQLKSDNRHKDVSRARRAAFAALRHLGLGYTTIGRILRKDHSTVIAGLRRFADEKVMNKTLGRTVLG